jgi:lipoprotein-anchoring transpeptidase ErfK/SrfK
LGAVLALSILASSCHGGETSAADAAGSSATTGGPTPTGGTSPPTSTGSAPVNRSYVARSRAARLDLFAAPGGTPSTPAALDDPIASGAPLVLLITATQPGWLEVLLPVRPNGSRAWVRGSDVSVEEDDWRVEVHLTDHQLVVFDGPELWMAEPIAVGREPTPTPGGTFYLTELLQPPDPNGDYGPYAFGLSGFSDDLTSFNGGDGRLGLHGTDDPGSLGLDVSHGCIRVSNEAITQLARTLPLGTPVVILP